MNIWDLLQTNQGRRHIGLTEKATCEGRGDGNRTETCSGSIHAGVEGEEEEKYALAAYRNNLLSV